MGVISRAHRAGGYDGTCSGVFGGVKEVRDRLLLYGSPLAS
jgi:hypothetical protein